MAFPLVSVIIPVYNRPSLVLEALESVLSQTCSDFEIIVVDDGSDDNTPGILQEFKERASELRPEISVLIIRQIHSGMAGQVRNRGVKDAAGSLIAFLDSDDLWVPEKLELQTACFRNNPQVQIVHTREHWRRGEKTVSQKTQKHLRKGDVFLHALEKCILGPSTVMMKSELFRATGGFHESTEIAEDYEYWLRLTASCLVDYLEAPLTIKRAGKWDQLSEKYGQIEIFRINALKRLVEEKLLPRERVSDASEALARKCRIYAAGCLKRGKVEEADKFNMIAAKYKK